MTALKQSQLDWVQTANLATDCLKAVFAMLNTAEGGPPRKYVRHKRMYPIPRGGHFAALMLQNAHLKVEQSPLNPGYYFHITNDPSNADFAVDDIIDSGATAARIEKKYGLRTFALVDKVGRGPDFVEWGWVVFPWEVGQERDPRAEDAGPAENVRRLLQFAGEDPDRPGLKETPGRVLAAMSEMLSGYSVKNPADVLKTFDDGAAGYDELILVKGIPFTSLCEHHLLPFSGVAHVGYIPNQAAPKIVGLSKLARLVNVFARRLQVQERITTQVTKTLDDTLSPAGSVCVIEAEHHCMSCRGVNRPGVKTVTSSMTGVFRSKPEARAEVLQLIHKG